MLEEFPDKNIFMMCEKVNENAFFDKEEVAKYFFEYLEKRII